MLHGQLAKVDLRRWKAVGEIIVKCKASPFQIYLAFFVPYPDARPYPIQHLEVYFLRNTEVDVKELEPTLDLGLYQNIKVNPAEIVYEITTQKNALPFGIATADIQLSEPHFHEVTTETNTVVQGNLEVSLNGEQHVLHPGDVIKIPPNVIHSARSLSVTPARITVTTIPEFSQEDYYLVEQDAG